MNEHRKMHWDKARIGKTYYFSAAHFLTGVSSDHPCAKMHGHNYKVEVEVRGDVSPRTGFIIDFHEIDNVIKPLIKRLDHTTLNDTVENPTAENIARWIMDEYPVKYLFSVKVWETDNCWAQVVNAGGLYSHADKVE